MYLCSFDKLDYGTAEVIDRFYNADLAFIDLSVETQQYAMAYHIGVRESLGKSDSIILKHFEKGYRPQSSEVSVLR